MLPDASTQFGLIGFINSKKPINHRLRQWQRTSVWLSLGMTLAAVAVVSRYAVPNASPWMAGLAGGAALLALALAARRE